MLVRKVLKFTSFVSKNDQSAFARVDNRSVNRKLKLAKIDVVSDIPEIPKLGVKPLRKPALRSAVSHNLIIVKFVLLATLGPLFPTLNDSPELAVTDSVGVSCSV